MPLDHQHAHDSTDNFQLYKIKEDLKIEEPYAIKPGLALSIWQDKYARRVCPECRNTLLVKRVDNSNKYTCETHGEITQQVYQTWEERLREVVLGNFLLSPQPDTEEFKETLALAVRGLIPFSGRHLQHGDADQPKKILELHSNCFDGETKVATIEFGPITFDQILNKTVTVKCKDGEWRKAIVKKYGIQTMYKYVFGSKYSKSNLHHEVIATENHRWFLENGTETTNLAVGDCLQVCDNSWNKEDKEAILHGLVFGDGSGHGNQHKKRSANPTWISVQGRQYCSIRLCGEDKNKYLSLFTEQGYSYSCPPHAAGDPVVYVGKNPWKDLPFTTDPNYIAGFIKGLWYADGSHYEGNALTIYTADIATKDWLLTYAVYGGYILTGYRVMERKEDDGSFENGKPLHVIILANSTRKLISKEYIGRRMSYCLEEPITQSFVLANGLLTGNCATAPFSFLTFLKLLCGSGVSSDYSTRIRVVNWDLMPNFRLVLNGGDNDSGDISKGAHPDFAQSFFEFKGGFESLREAKHKYPSDSEWVRWFTVKDSREGWAEIISALETAAYHEKHRDKLFIFDLSGVRAAGSPILGQQGRPASGPIPLMRALLKVASIKGAYMTPWKQALFIDDYMSSCVSVGGIRRSARLAAKWWEDRDIFDFIEIKRGGHLRMANNSILVSKKFWQEVSDPRTHAYRVFHAAIGAAYYDNTGEPGFINVDNMRQNRQGVDKITVDNYIDMTACGMELHPRTYDLIQKVLERIKSGPYLTITNPCITADTWIATNKGLQQVKDITDNNWQEANNRVIYVVNGRKHVGSPFFTTGYRSVVKMVTKEGHYLRATDDHKVVVEVADKQYSIAIKDLQPGDKIVLSNQRSSINLCKNANPIEGAGYALGIFIGDGDFINGNIARIRLWDNKQYCANKISAWLNWKEEEDYIQEISDSVVVNVGWHTIPSNCRTLCINSKKLGELAINLGLSEGHKTLTDVIMKSSSYLLQGFIAGIFDTDGSVQGSVASGVSLRISSSNRGLLERLQIVLLRFGINSRLRKAQEEGIRLLPDNKGRGEYKEHNCQENYELMIERDNWIRFVKMFDLQNPIHLEKIEDLLKQYKTAPYEDKFTAKFSHLEKQDREAVYDCRIPGINHFSGNGLMAHNCSEACLPSYGDDCIVGDIGLHLVNNVKEAQRASFLLAKALVRVKSFMPGIYRGEGQRSNRVGVSGIGILEFFWRLYKLDFFDMVSVYEHVFNKTPLTDSKQETVLQAWQDIASIAYHGEKGAIEESRKFNLSLPDTVTMLKPGGTVAKVMSATESANLPARPFYLRYIQHPKDSQIAADYKNRGYPVVDISHKYSGYAVIGFPTEQPYVKMLKEADHPEDRIAVANKVSMQDNFKWLRLLEKFWLEYGEPSNGMPRNAQAAFTLKYNPDEVGFDEFLQIILQHQPTIRCCTYNVCSSDDKVMAQTKELIENYGYVPEYPLTWQEYQEITSRIQQAENELYDDNANGCENGTCSIDGNIN